jgi:hypothetical protein
LRLSLTPHPPPPPPPPPKRPGNLTITSSDAVPLIAPVGPYSMRMQAWNADGGEGVMCIDIWFRVAGGPTAAAAEAGEAAATGEEAAAAAAGAAAAQGGAAAGRLRGRRWMWPRLFGPAARGGHLQS